METKYKCEVCGSELSGIPGTCCGKERKIVDSTMVNKEHNHGEGEVCEVCNADTK